MLEIARLLCRLLLVVLPVVPCVGSSHSSAPVPVTVGPATYSHLPVACRIAADDPARDQAQQQALLPAPILFGVPAIIGARGEATADVAYHPTPCHFALHRCAGTLRS